MDIHTVTYLERGGYHNPVRDSIFGGIKGCNQLDLWGSWAYITFAYFDVGGEDL